MAPGLGWGEGKQTQKGKDDSLGGRGWGALGFGSSDFWVDKWSLSARWVRGGKEGVSPEPSPRARTQPSGTPPPEPSPVPGPSPVDSSSPSEGLHSIRCPKGGIFGAEGSGDTLARFFAAAGWAWEWLTYLFSSGSFCRIILAPFSMPHVGKTESVCVSLSETKQCA